MDIGKKHILRALRLTSVGFFLGNEKGEEVLLPNKYIPDWLNVDQEIEVFIYKDYDERPIATTLEPYLTLNSFACLEVMAIDRFGAFLDWGLEKQLFVPFKEQNKKMEQGRWYVVYLYLDETTNRLVGSARVNRYLVRENINLIANEAVELLVYEKTDLGYNAIINNKYKGLLYENEIFQKIIIGDELDGFVKKVRDDNQVDLSLQKLGFENLEVNAKKLLETLNIFNGYLELTDKSSSEDIIEQLQMSKKTFKRALGILYKNRQVRIEPEGIYLLKNDSF